MLTAEHTSLGIVVVKQINPLEAIVRWAGNLHYAYRHNENDEVTIGRTPADVHSYTIKLSEDEAVRSSATTLLFNRGLEGVGYRKCMPNVVETRYTTIPEKYAVEGDKLVHPTEAELEAIPGVEKVIYQGFFKAPETRYDYRDGQLYYAGE